MEDVLIVLLFVYFFTCGCSLQYANFICTKFVTISQQGWLLLIDAFSVFQLIDMYFAASI